MLRFTSLLCVTLALGLSGCSKDKGSGSDRAAGAQPPAAGTTAPASGVRRVEISVTKKGFEPSPIEVERGQPLELVVTRKTDDTCAKDIVIAEHGIKKALPLGEPVVVAFTPTQSGELRYGCAMDMMVSGVLHVK